MSALLRATACASASTVGASKATSSIVSPRSRARSKTVCAYVLLAAAYEQLDRSARGAQIRRGVDRLQPALVGIEAADFEQQAAPVEHAPDVRGVGAVRLREDALGNPVRDDERRSALQREFELHVAAHAGDLCGARERGEVDRVKAVGVVGVPRDRETVAHAAFARETVEFEHGAGNLPILARAPATRRRAADRR